MTKLNETTPQVVKIPYSKLLSGQDLTTLITNAFGKEGLGIFLITGVPNLLQKREKILRVSKQFAELPESIKEKYTHPESHYSYGWSHGKEKMKDGKTDTAKGSYYANPVFDLTDDEELKVKYPGVYTDNIWPTEDCPEMEPAFKVMGQLNLEISDLVNKQLDNYLVNTTKGKHQKDFFQKHAGGFFKSRLLHYFPIVASEKTEPCQKLEASKASKASETNDDIDNFCGWHLDHGALTVLLSPMYLDSNGNKVAPPSEGGLFIKNAHGINVKVSIPEDCLAVQLGELGQLYSGGIFRATPHCVSAKAGENISREQLAMFSDVHPEFEISVPDYGNSFEEVVNCPFLPSGVPPLKGRLEGVETYKEFANNTYAAYANLA